MCGHALHNCLQACCSGGLSRVAMAVKLCCCYRWVPLYLNKQHQVEIVWFGWFLDLAWGLIQEGTHVLWFFWINWEFGLFSFGSNRTHLYAQGFQNSKKRFFSVHTVKSCEHWRVWPSQVGLPILRSAPFTCFFWIFNRDASLCLSPICVWVSCCLQTPERLRKKTSWSTHLVLDAVSVSFWCHSCPRWTGICCSSSFLRNLQFLKSCRSFCIVET